MTDGSSQEQRVPAALTDLANLADGRDLPALLAATRAYADGLGFVDGRGQADGSWAPLLDADESALLARLLSLPVADVESNFLDDLAAGRTRQLQQTLEMLDAWRMSWVDALTQIGRTETTDARGADVIRRLAAAASQAQLDGPTRGPDSGSDSGGERALRSRLFARTDLLRRLQAIAATRFADSLDTEVHEPAAALLLALTRVHASVQDRLNQFPDRLADYYYQDCLGETHRDALPDKVHLTFRRDPLFAGTITVPKGTNFAAGKDADGLPINFAADEALTITDAAVAAVYSLRAQRDPFFAAAQLLGQVTRVTLADLSGSIGTTPQPTGETAAIMGGAVAGCNVPEADARIGLAISSPTLALAQGKREIRLVFDMLTSNLDQIKAAIAQARTPKAFAAALGRLFAAWLLANEMKTSKFYEVAELAQQAAPGLGEVADRGADGGADGGADAASGGSGPSFLASLVEACNASRASVGQTANQTANLGDHTEADELLELLFGSANACELQPAFDRRRRLARDTLFPAFFRVELSTATGWLQIADPVPLAQPAIVARASAPGHAMPNSAAPAGMTRAVAGLRLLLRPSDPAIAACTALHGDELQIGVPALRLTLDPDAGMFGLSVLGECLLTAILIDVDVSGLRDLELHNQIGPLDSAKPFQPFGPLPDPASYLVIGSAEVAAKRVTQYRLQLDWTGLPPNGLAEHYRGYPVPFDDRGFLVTPAILRDGTWVPAGAAQPLFAIKNDIAAGQHCIDVTASALAANWRAMADPVRYGPGTTGGFVKLQFTAPAAGFGDALYPVALSAALRVKPRQASSQGAAPPNPPVSPRLAQLTLDYSAAAIINIGGEPGPDRVIHLYPIGVRTVHPLLLASPLPAMLPRFEPDGQLLIGLTGTQVSDDLTLLFDLRVDTALPSPEGPVAGGDLAWSWLGGDVWRPLENWRVRMDGTRGFLRSGIVRLSLPQQLPAGNSTMPGDMAWLRVATDRLSFYYGGLRGIAAQALAAVRTSAPPALPLPSGTITLGSASIPGVLAITQPLPGFDLQPAETTAQTRTRIGERLRHKGRAVTAWDYERLVLEAFPSVYKVKCLPNLSPQTRPCDAPGCRLQERPGHVLIVLVPNVPAWQRNQANYGTRPLRIDAWEIEKIRVFLAQRSSPLVQLQVISATYEHLQARCRIELSQTAQIGTALAAVKQQLIGVLSPWYDIGLRTSFDWSISSYDLHSAIRSAHPDIIGVSDVSLLRIWEDDRTGPSAGPGAGHNASRQLTKYDLLDSSSASAVIKASRPWSLPLPFSRHIVDVVGLGEAAAKAEPTGLADDLARQDIDASVGLEVGSTFVITGTPEEQGQWV